MSNKRSRPRPDETTTQDGPAIDLGSSTIDSFDEEAPTPPEEKESLLGHPEVSKDHPPERHEIGRYFHDGKVILQYAGE